ncbi:hypothetical protein M758_UG291400 [Ceratodon purpureus]|nr:hypothetical protein M758_UG291400 [Ceratodon purpureus]
MADVPFEWGSLETARMSMDAPAWDMCSNRHYVRGDATAAYLSIARKFQVIYRRVKEVHTSYRRRGFKRAYNQVM